jgi:hypothetical protein
MQITRSLDRRARARADEQQLVGIAQALDGLDQDVQLLLPRRTAGEDQHPLTAGQAQLRRKASRSPGRIEEVSVSTPSGRPMAL